MNQRKRLKTSVPFFIIKFIFNWRITVLQFCVGFCQTSAWISHRYTSVSSFLNLPLTPSPAQPSVAAKLLQSCPTLYAPIDGCPPGSSVPGILQARILEWVAISLSNASCMLSHFSPVRLCATLWTAAHQAPLSTGFSRQEYWSGLPFPSLAHPSRLLQSPSLSSLSHTANSHWLFIPLSLLNTSHERSLSLPPTVLSALTEWGPFADWKLSKYMEQTLT